MFFSLSYCIIFVNLILLFAFILTASLPQHFLESDCKISDFQEIGKRKNKKTPTFFVIFMISIRFFTFLSSLFIENPYLCTRF